jgi:hypothetical protein
MTPIRAIILILLGFGALAAFLVVFGTLTKTIDPTAALGVIGTVITALIGVVAVRIAADAKADRGKRDDRDSH